MQDLFTFTPLHFPTFGSQRTVFWNLEKYWAWISQNFSKNPYSFNSKKDYLCSLLWNYEANCEAPFAVCFEITKQTAKHPLQFQSKLQSTLCSFKPSFVVFIKVQRSFVVWIETAKCALQFALKVRSVLCSLLWKCEVCFAVCFEISKQTAKVFYILTWNCFAFWKILWDSCPILFKMTFKKHLNE